MRSTPGLADSIFGTSKMPPDFTPRANPSKPKSRRVATLELKPSCLFLMFWSFKSVCTSNDEADDDNKKY